jgi:hypothetical protein
MSFYPDDNYYLDVNYEAQYAVGHGAVEGNYGMVPYGFHIDAEGRLLKDIGQNVDVEYLPEDVNVFKSSWQKPQLSAKNDWEWTTKFVWPDIDGVVSLRRLDIFEKGTPKLQIATTDLEESRQLRITYDMFPVRSVFFLNVAAQGTTKLLIESAAPPRRSKYRPKEKQNQRDLSKWLQIEELDAFFSPMGVPGSCQFYIDYCDFPDRYFISSNPDPDVGQRRLYRFAAYSTTQFYVLEKKVYHQALDADGGSGYTYTIEAGPKVFTRKDWRIIGSFYGFDQQLPGSSLYKIYRRSDPFPRMYIALEDIEHADEWSMDLQFYAFDIPIPGTARYSLQHCLRSVYSVQASIPRHRLTTADARMPWEFRMTLYMMPADLPDCTIERPN